MSEVLLAAVSPSLLDTIWPGQCWSWWGMKPDDAAPIKNQILPTITSVHISMHNGHSSMFDLYTRLICGIFAPDPAAAARSVLHYTGAGLKY